MFYAHTPSPGGGTAAAAAASFFAAASAVDAAASGVAVGASGYLLPYGSCSPCSTPSTLGLTSSMSSMSISSLVGAPIYRTTSIPPPPPVPHIAYFAYAPNTAPITVSITYPSQSTSSSSASSGFFSADSPRPCSAAAGGAWRSDPSCGAHSTDSSASSLSGFRCGPRRDRFAFGCGGGELSDDNSGCSPPPSLAAAMMDCEPECLEVQPVESMFGAGDYTIKCIVKGVVGEGAARGALAAAAAAAAAGSQGAAVAGNSVVQRRDSAASTASTSTTTPSCSSEDSSEDQSDAADSGRATGGLASSLSPMDNSATTTPNGTMFDANPMYEFEIPNSLVGLIIGVKGKTIKELSVRTDVRMLIRQHHETAKVDTHQICQVRGKREKINRCLQMLRKRFPPGRFPELNLQPVLPPALPTNLADLLNAQPSWLTLPENVACEAAVAHLIDAGHLFIQQPTHPSYSSLALLDQYMIRLYTQSEGIPEVPHPCDNGLLCAAPVMQAWFRAVIVMYFPEEDEALVRFVDYGGYAKIAREQLRQIRTDLMTLPFQATECFLAHVQPVDGTSQWSAAATEYLREIVFGKVVDVTLIGYSVDEKIPVVEIEVIDESAGTKQRADRLMIDAGFAKAADPSKVARIPKMSLDGRKPVMSKQTSYTTSPSSTILAC